MKRSILTAFCHFGFVHVMFHVCHMIPCLSCDPAMCLVIG